MRAVPDVASDADPNTGILVVYGGGQEAQYGGTSIATPAWAGLMGLVNAQRIVRGKPTLGLVAARTTSLVDTSNLSDITSGNNGYPAGIGYDLVTGAGTPVMRNLIVTLVKQP
jgi:kumamolisin